MIIKGLFVIKNEQNRLINKTSYELKTISQDVPS